MSLNDILLVVLMVEILYVFFLQERTIRRLEAALAAARQPPKKSDRFMFESPLPANRKNPFGGVEPADETLLWYWPGEEDDDDEICGERQ